MRTFAFFGAAAIAASLFASGNALAWSTEQPSQQDQNSVTFSDDSLKTLEDKVNAKFGTGSQFQSGFYISGSAGSGDPGPMGPPSRLQSPPSSYSPPANLPPCFYGNCGR